MHDSDLSQAEAVTECADRCAACGDCSWFGFVTTVYVCEYWKAGSCAARQGTSRPTTSTFVGVKEFEGFVE